MTIKKQQHLGALDGLRALAALIVLFTHGASINLWFSDMVLDGHQNSGALGVSLFFSLSGFLMGYLYLGKDCTPLGVRNYVISRFSRIAPAYLTVILLSFIIYNYIDSGFVYAIDGRNLLRHLAFAGNVSIFWSIPPEVQFYAFFILLWVSIYRYRSRSDVILLAISVAAIVASLVFRDHVPGTSLPSKMHFFITGALAGFLRKAYDVRTFKGMSVVQFGFLAAIFGLCAKYILEGDYASPYGQLDYAILCSTGIYFLSIESFLGSKVFGSRPLFYIGQWSFSLYLTHDPILRLLASLVAQGAIHKVVAQVAAVPASLVLSFLFFKFIEMPSQKYIKGITARGR